MAVEYNTTVVTSGLLANYDFTNRKSFTPTQNLFTYSQDFTNVIWTKNTATITGNTVLAPDGTLTGQTITEDTSTSQHLITQAPITVATGQVYTLSVYAKAGTRTQISLTAWGEGYSAFNLSTGTVIQTGGHICSITDVGDGWYRCSATITKTNSTGNFYIIMWNNTNSYLGTSAYQYIWGAQLERNSSLNDYVTTTTPSSTRSTNIIDTIGGYNMSNSYGNNAIYINTTNSFMQFTRATAVPKDGGGATVGTSGALTVTNFLYNDHTWEIWFRIDDRAPGNTIWTADANEGASALSVYQGYHAGFTYSSTVMYYIIWNGVASAPTCASWTVGASGAQINQDSWYQIVVTRSGNVFTPYINGAPLGTGSTTVTSATGIGTSNNLWLGKTANVAAGAGAFLNYSRNSVANMKMYNRALSAEEINSNFQALRGRFGI